MKKKLIALIISGMFVLSSSAPVLADEKDDRIAELEAQVTALQTQLEETQKQLEEALAKNPASTSQEEYKIGETWTVEGQWNVTINSVEEIQDRNEYSDYAPAAVYMVTYTYENIGYKDEDGIMDGLYISMEDRIVDSTGKMGYSYPGDVTMYPQETPVGAKCEAQACIGVDNAGSFKIYVDQYDGTNTDQSAVFNVEI